MMPTSELIATVRKGAQCLDFTMRFLVLDMCDRLERKIKDNELLAQRIVEHKRMNDHKTNADHIRAMSDEELAKLLLDGCRGSKCEDQPVNDFGSVNCFDCRMNWLQQPAEDE